MCERFVCLSRKGIAGLARRMAPNSPRPCPAVPVSSAVRPEADSLNMKKNPEKQLRHV